LGVVEFNRAKEGLGRFLVLAKASQGLA